MSVFLEKIIIQRNIKKAQSKLKQYKCKIIAITGSYGKTSCKNYIYELIKDHYKVLKSKLSYNTINGLLLTINNELKPYHEYLIIEIGVDKINSLDKFNKLFSYDIAILTCIGPQHLKTFKSIENIAIEKSKIFNNCIGCSILNIDDDNIIRKNIKSNIITTSTFKQANIYIDEHNKNIKIYDNTYKLNCNLLGKHNYTNLALCVGVCKYLNIQNEDILNKISLLKNVKHRLSTFIDGNWLILDDSYNSNLIGFSNALDVLKNYESYKVLITPGIIETNDDINKEYFKLIDKIESICDLILLTNNNKFFTSIKNKLVFNDFNGAYSYLKGSYKDQKLTILIENDLPDIFLR